MIFTHDTNVQTEYPNNFTGLISVTGVCDHTNLVSNIETLKTKVELNEKLDEIINLWRAVFTKMNAKKKYTSSLESLYDYYNNNGILYEINPVVDLYNFYSLVNGYPMAAYDVTKFEGDLKLAFAPKGFMFSPLGNPKNKLPSKPKEIAYVDDKKVICRYWNLQDCDETKIKNDTNNILFIFDIIASSSSEAIDKFTTINNDFSAYFNDIKKAEITGAGLASSVEL